LARPLRSVRAHTFGGDGAEADAVILSQLTGKPVRVQWTLQEDLAWSSVSPAYVLDLKAALDPNGHVIAFRSASYTPHQSDARLLGAILAGCLVACRERAVGCHRIAFLSMAYDKIPTRLEEAYGMPNLAAESASGGLRGNIMRTPGQRQQNFAVEGLMNEAAASAGADPIQFRINHITDQRLIDILNATAKAAGWEPRPSPHRARAKPAALPCPAAAYASSFATTPTGWHRGNRRRSGYWRRAGDQVRDRRRLRQDHQPAAARPLHEERRRHGPQRSAQGRSHLDKSKVTSTNWTRYKILTMEETPEIRSSRSPAMIKASARLRGR